MTRPRLLTIALLVSVTVDWTAAAHGAAADALWSSRPYRVAIDLDLDRSGLTTSQQARLRRDMLETIRNRLGRFCDVRFGAEETPAEPAQSEDEALPLDKRLRCELLADAGGVTLSVREHDVTLDQAGLEHRVTVAEAAALPERLYGAVIDAFRPIARFQRDPASPGRVTLAYRAGELTPDSGIGVAREGDLLLPYRRRLSRDGASVEGSVHPVRWTYLVAEAPGEGEPGAEVVSHSRRSLGGRPSARIEQLAIVAPIDPDLTTRLRLRSLGEQATPLPGYEVLVGDAKRSSLESLGFSDAAGEVRIPPADDTVRFAHVRCGTLFVASVPVAPGVDEVVEIPLVDERPRLRAELEVTSLRERLIDTVARRKILGERIKRAIEEERIELASELLTQLDELPGRTQFSRELDQAERGAVAPHPVAQKRLDELFSTTRQLVNAALDPRELRDITLAVDRARQTAQADTAASPAEPAPNG